MPKPAKNQVKFWAQRARRYNKLEWANKGDYLRLFLEAGDFSESDLVLDVGTGTGIIAHTIAPFVSNVIGVDICEDMLKKAKEKKFHNLEYKISNAHSLPFDSNSFDKITARMVFHHITEKTQEAMNECFRVLKKGGKMVFSEGIPPSHHVIPFYTEMFKLKEKRITFMESDLVQLMKRAGFHRITKLIYIAKQSSIRNWLENSNLPKNAQEKIFQMHIDLDLQGRKDYRMTLKDGDCFIDMKFVILTGFKK
jgi:ubiquinone/menaquinone biosynthesis C-methylase UbiE